MIYKVKIIKIIFSNIILSIMYYYVLLSNIM